MAHRAGFWIRVLASAIDVVAMLLIGGGVALAIDALESHTTFAVAQGGFDALLCLLWLIYTSAEVWAGATPGKLLLRLRITTADCAPADTWRLFLRWSTKWSWLALNFLFVLSEWPPLYVLGGFISFIVVIGCLYAANDDRLAWHDQWAGTAVCHHPRRYQAFDVAAAAAAAAPPPLPPLPPAQPPPSP